MAATWRSEGILRQDSAPSIYPIRRPLLLPRATNFERRGFIALGRVEDYSAKVVFRHEQTLSKPKADRLDLLRATRAHYEQLFLLYEDSGEIDSLLAPPAVAPPPSTSPTNTESRTASGKSPMPESLPPFKNRCATRSW